MSAVGKGMRKLARASPRNQTVARSLLEEVANRFAGEQAIIGAHVQMRHESNSRRRPFGHPNVLLSSGLGDAASGVSRREIYHDDIRIGRNDRRATSSIDQTGERVSVGMIVRQPVEVMFDAV